VDACVALAASSLDSHMMVRVVRSGRRASTLWVLVLPLDSMGA
jgi:hypothetical protein